ncbi:MAG: sprT domain-containing protein, partial [Flavobacteriaceae bacterium]|nr:sprT domain-containing protein [Flavobacteriaceae bacterium]
MKNPSATTDSDIDLVISLSKYDKHNDSVFLFDVMSESLFEFNNQIYKKIGKLRKRYICKEIIKNKKYLFSPVARVKKI